MQDLKGAAHSLRHGFRQTQVAHLQLLHGNYFLALHRETWHLVVTDKQINRWNIFLLPVSYLISRSLSFPNNEWKTIYEQLWFLREVLVPNDFSFGRSKMFHILQEFGILVDWAFWWKWNLVHVCVYLYLLPLKQLCFLRSFRFLQLVVLEISGTVKSFHSEGTIVCFRGWIQIYWYCYILPNRSCHSTPTIGSLF